VKSSEADVVSKLSAAFQRRGPRSSLMLGPIPPITSISSSTSAPKPSTFNLAKRRSRWGGSRCIQEATLCLSWFLHAAHCIDSGCQSTSGVLSRARFENGMKAALVIYKGYAAPVHSSISAQAFQSFIQVSNSTVFFFFLPTIFYRSWRIDSAGPFTPLPTLNLSPP
jgi:hypothetical protein